MFPGDSDKRAAAARDVLRARELYKYFQPPRSADNSIATSRCAPPDTVLTAYAQLVSWRLNTQRALISFLDRDTQYFVAESTKTLNIANIAEHDDPNDAVWAGCVSVPKAGRLCEHTIQQLVTEDGRAACFEVLDLAADDRFNSLPFIAGAPYFRYYAGVPLRTRKGVAIGSLFAMDDKVREPLTDSEKNFLSVMATNVMSHLELLKEKEDRKRAVNMNMRLSAFVDPEYQSRGGLKHTPSFNTSHVPQKNPAGGERETMRCTNGHKRSSVSTSPKVATTAPRSPRVKVSPRSSSTPGSRSKSSGRRSVMSQGRRTASVDGDSDTSESDSEPAESKVGADDRIETFQRAAELLRESLSLECGGGVVFMNTCTALPSNNGRPPMPFERSSDHISANSKEPLYSPGGRPTVYFEAGQFSEVLAFSEMPGGNDEAPESPHPSFIPLSPSDLARLIRRHPRGKLYSFDDNGINFSGSSGDEVQSNGSFNIGSMRRGRASKTESAILIRAFPNARQIIFLPMWDVTSSRWAACFAYNTDDYRSFSHNTEFLHAIAFCNCLMTEISRLAILAADQQKSDFIGSISHELRSPLHGILASCEFLEDTECSSYQKTLVSTADSCARTLLDTINMVLDYSKINTFERNIRKAKRSRKDIAAAAAAKMPMLQQASLNIYESIDLAAVTEEVVEGVALGHNFKDFTTFAPDNPSQDETCRMERRQSAASITRATRPEVEIFIDIPPHRWNFITQPGAFRRVVMNLFGNALKYTKVGYIKVKLDVTEVETPAVVKSDTHETPTSSVATLTVSDTGQGISPQYLKTKIFAPFSQESPLNPGTGLGLSLVRSIVDMLNGEITIRSALGVGTEVVVRLPVVRGSPSGSNASTNSTPASASSSIERPIDNTIVNVRQMASNLSVAVFRPSDYDEISNPTTVDAMNIARATVINYLQGWYNFKQVLEWSPSEATDIILLDEVDLPHLLQMCPRAGSSTSGSPMLAIIRASASMHASTTDFLLMAGHSEFISRPCGPYKLARAMKNLIEHRSKCASGREHASEPVKNVEANPVEEVATHVDQLTLETQDPNSPIVSVLQQGGVMGNEESIGAQMALDTLPSPQQAVPNEQEEYPFPDVSPISDGITSPSFTANRPHLEHSRTMSWTPREIEANEAPAASPMTNIGLAVSTPTQSDASNKPTPPATPATPRHPRLLCVDDNKVNLRLLQTFMKKRAYTNVSSAEDGAQAVSVFTSLISQNPPKPPDIIFMDISMPIMNGFEATRRIREIEARYRDEMPPMQRPAPSLIVALTGLASGRDQSEAFTSGFDLYMTKPVSFREVGRLLDNWQANGGTTADQVPHGPVTGRVK